jgi:hypothetical protein
MPHLTCTWPSPCIYLVKLSKPSLSKKKNIKGKKKEKKKNETERESRSKRKEGTEIKRRGREDVNQQGNYISHN